VNHALAYRALEQYQLYSNQQEIYHTIHIVVSLCLRVEKKKLCQRLERDWLAARLAALEMIYW